MVGSVVDIESVDLRVQKTLDSIHKSFESLMIERPFEKITVTELCARARINKKTFYRYYQTIDSLLEEYEDWYASEYTRLTAGMRYPDQLCEVTRVFLEFSASQGAMYDAIVCDDMHTRLFEKISKAMESERFARSVPVEGWTAEEWGLYMVGVTSLQWEMYRAWVKGGKAIPLERLIQITCGFLSEGASLQ